MAGFSFTAAAATCDGADLATIARTEGTPLYVYSRASIEQRYRALDAALAPYPHRIHYALKANSTRGLLEILRAAGAGADANSGGEIAVARRAGLAPDDIVFTGVGKSAAELEAAVAADLHAINAESAGELERIDRIAQARGVRTRVAVRPSIRTSTPRVTPASPPAAGRTSSACRSTTLGGCAARRRRPVRASASSASTRTSGRR